MTITFESTYGSQDPVPAVGPVPADFTFNTPIGLTLDSQGNLWVADSGNNRITVFDPTLQTILKTFGTAGSDRHAQFNLPFRLAHLATGNRIAVTDVANCRVQILQYEYTGSSLHEITVDSVIENPLSPSAGQPQLTGPNGIVALPAGNALDLIIADEFARRNTDQIGGNILGFNVSQQLTTSFGVVGAHELRFPQELAVDSRGNIYICNTGEGTILRCDQEGNPVVFPETGEDFLHGFILPRGIAVINDRLYVADIQVNTVYIYDLNGKSLGFFMAPSPLLGPMDFCGARPGHGSPDTEYVYVSFALTNVVAEWELMFVSGESNAVNADVTRFIGGCRAHSPQQFNGVSAARVMTCVHEAIPDFLTEFWDSYFPWLIPLLPKTTTSRNTDTFNSSLSPKYLGEKTWAKSMTTSYRFGDPVDGHRLATPYGVAISPAGCALHQRSRAADTRIFVVDSFGKKTAYLPPSYQFQKTIHVYDGNLHHLHSFGMSGNAYNELGEPSGIAVRKIRGSILDVVVTDLGRDAIFCWEYDLNADCVLDSSPIVIGGQGSEFTPGGPPRFMEPRDIDFDSAGRIFVADQFNSRIQVLDREGNCEFEFGREGYSDRNVPTTDEQLKFIFPKSVRTVGPLGYVSDLINRAIKVFKVIDNSVTFEDAFYGFGANPNTGDVWLPHFLEVFGDHILLPDNLLNRVNIYTRR